MMSSRVRGCRRADSRGTLAPLRRRIQCRVRAPSASNGHGAMAREGRAPCGRVARNRIVTSLRLGWRRSGLSRGSREQGDRMALDFAHQQAIGQVSRIETVADALALEAEWRSLEARVPEATPFQGFDWCRAWLEAAGRANAPEALRILAVRHDGRLRLLWPIAIRRLWGFRVAHWLAEPLTQYGDVLVEPEQRMRWLDMALREIRAWSDVDALEFRRVRADAAVMALPAVAAEAARALDHAPFLDLRAGCGAALRTSRTRNTLRRRLKQLQALGPVRCELVEAPAAQRRAVAEALGFKARWLEARGPGRA